MNFREHIKFGHKFYGKVDYQVPESIYWQTWQQMRRPVEVQIDQVLDQVRDQLNEIP